MFQGELKQVTTVYIEHDAIFKNPTRLDALRKLPENWRSIPDEYKRAKHARSRILEWQMDRMTFETTITGKRLTVSLIQKSR